MRKGNQIVHSMWIGNRLSPLELLTLASFVENGHLFHLWVYDELQVDLPENVTLRDANEIVEEKHIFRYENHSNLGHGKGSLAGFSDIFRYKLLFMEGGWWVDMDVTCLDALDLESDYAFRKAYLVPAVGNVMKCPARSLLMQRCYERAVREVKAKNTDWLKPLIILNEEISQLGLERYTSGDWSSPELWWLVEIYRSTAMKVPENCKVIHWMNESWRYRGLSKDCAVNGSLLSKLLKKHGVLHKELFLIANESSSG